MILKCMTYFNFKCPLKIRRYRIFEYLLLANDSSKAYVGARDNKW